MAARTRASCASPGSTASSCPRRPGTRAARSGPPCTPTGSTSGARTDRCPTTRTGAAPWTRTSSSASRARTGSRSSAPPRIASSSSGSRRSSRTAASSAGWTAGASSARARRDARPAQPRGEVSRGVPALRAGRPRRGGGPLLRPPPRRRTAVPLHVRRVSGPSRVALAARCGDPRRRDREGAGGGRGGLAPVPRAPARVRRPERDPGAAQHLVQPLGRADRRARGRGVLDLPPLGDRSGRRRSVHRREGASERRAPRGGGGLVIRRRGKLRSGALVAASIVPSTIDLVRALWQDRARKRWLVPLVVFLALTAVLLLLAASVEALAPFIYSIF